MRRFTLITLIVLFTLLVAATFFQVLAGRGGKPRYCGPGQTAGCVRSPAP